MNSKKSSSASTRPLAEEIEERILSDVFTTAYFTTGREDRQQGFVEKMLPRGKVNAVTTEALMKLSGISDKRRLQQIIRSERDSGALIASRAEKPGGYYIPVTLEELRSFERTCHRRAISTLAMLKNTRVALSQVKGQLRIDSEA